MKMPKHIADKYAAEIEQVKRSTFWNTPMTPEKLAPITAEDIEKVAELLKQGERPSQGANPTNYEEYLEHPSQ